MHQSDISPSLEGIRMGPALTALVQATAQALSLLSRELRAFARASEPDPSLPETLDKKLADIEGALRFAGACSQTALLTLMRQLLSAAGVQVTPAAQVPIGVVDIFAQACDCLIATLPRLRMGLATPPAHLLAVWRDVCAFMPHPPLTPAAMISLTAGAEETSFCAALPLSVHAPEKPLSMTEIDSALLELLRAETRSPQWREALRTITSAIASLRFSLLSSPNSSRCHLHLHWAVMQVFCEQLAIDDALDLTLAKRILSSTVRAMRHSPAGSPVLNEHLLREALYQIGMCASPTEASLMLRQRSGLVWQFSKSEPYHFLHEYRATLHSLQQHIDALIPSWAGVSMVERRRHLEELAAILRRDMAFAALAASLANLASNLPDCADIVAAASLLMLRECAESLLADRAAARTISATVKAFDDVVAAMSDQASVMPLDWLRLHQAARSLMLPGSLDALKAAIIDSLVDTEHRLDGLLGEGNQSAATSLMSQTLCLTAGALALTRQAEALATSRLLLQRLVDEQGASHPVETNFSTLAAQWVQLCTHIRHWSDDDSHAAGDAVIADDSHLLSSTGEATVNSIENTPEYHLATGSEAHAPASDISTGEPLLRQIFIREATQRLERLQESLSAWTSNPGSSLPGQVVHDAHAMAGSSATAGMMSIHQWSRALEQVIDRLMLLPPQMQTDYAPVLTAGVHELERQLSEQQNNAAPESMALPDALHQLAAALDEFMMNQEGESSQQSAADHRHASQVTSAPASASASESESVSAPELQGSPAALPEMEKLPAPGSYSLDDEGRHPPLAAQDDYAHSADAELLALFSEEAAELLPQLLQFLGQWVEKPKDKALPAQILRLLHTLKGSARMAGELSLGEQLHLMEHEVEELARKDKIGLASLSVLQDEVRHILGDAGLLGTQQTTAMSCDHNEPSRESDAVFSGDKTPAEGAGPAPKIRTDLLERASGIAAELLVGAVRAAEDLQRQRQMVTELAENLSRLRAQLRELELQSESRIASQALPSASDFDPLEFDRYTRLQELTRMTAESLADLNSVQRSLARQTDTAATVLSQQTRHARMLQSDLRRASMQAFSSVELRFRHLARQAAIEAGREVRFELEGGQIEIDRSQLDRLNGALQHLIRNAVVHGIESPVQREDENKPRCGLVRLSLSQQGGELRLQISDDGRGLDLLRIRERAVERGLLSAETALDDASLAELIFAPGLSTADTVTGLAGRGIGMDAVKAVVTSMGGALKVDSLPDKGTSVTMALPQLLSTQRVVMVSDGERRIALPAGMVQQLIQLSATEVQRAIETGSIEWQRQSMPMRELSELLGGHATNSCVRERLSVIILRQLDQWLAVKVNEIHGHREVVFKRPSLQLAGVPGLSGATLMPDGSVLLIMNLLQLFERQGTHPQKVSPSSNADDDIDKAPLVMVVDDSLTVRRVSQRLLERHGYRVAVARNGVEALEQLHEFTPAAVLLDIEMPRMDGFELLGRLRADTRLKEIPVAMITSRAAERHRQHAMQLGANAYFGKPYREQELFEWLGLWAPLPHHGSGAEAQATDGADRAAA